MIIGESPTTISSCTRSLQRCVMSWLFTVVWAPIVWVVAWCTSAQPCVHPAAQLCCPVEASEGSQSRMATGQRFSCKSHHTLTGGPSVSGIPAARQFNPFCELSEFSSSCISKKCTGIVQSPTVIWLSALLAVVCKSEYKPSSTQI